MYSKIRRIVVHALTLAALAIVFHTWGIIIGAVVHTRPQMVVPLWQFIAAGLIAVGVSRATLTWSPVLRIALATVTGGLLVFGVTTWLAYAAAIPFRLTVSVLSLYAFALLAWVIALTPWDYRELREWFSITATILGVALLTSPFLAPLPMGSVLFYFAVAALLALGLTWEQQVELTVTHARAYPASLWMMLAAGTFFLAVVFVGRGMLTIRPFLALAATTGRMLFEIVLIPFGYLTAGLVWLMRLVQRLLPVQPPRAPEESGRGLGEILSEARTLAEANPIFLQILALLVGLLLIMILYAYLVSRTANPLSAIQDEREALQVELRWPKLPWTKPRKDRPIPLVREPKTIWDVLRYIETWGAAAMRPRQVGETAQEYARVIASVLPREALSTVVAGVEKVRYSDSELTAEEWQGCLAAWQQARLTVTTRKER